MTRPHSRQNTIRIGSSPLLIKGAAISYERKLQGKSSLVLNAQYEQFNSAVSWGLFHGDYNVSYTEFNILIVEYIVGETVLKDETERAGDKPLGAFPDIIPISTSTVDIGWRSAFSFGARFKGFLEPQLSSVLHHYYTVHQSDIQLSKQVEKFFYGAYPHNIKETHTTKRYVQRTEMRAINKWAPCFSVQIGLDYNWREKLVFEVKGGAMFSGASFNGTSSAILKPFQPRMTAMLGWRF